MVNWMSKKLRRIKIKKKNEPHEQLPEVELQECPIPTNELVTINKEDGKASFLEDLGHNSEREKLPIKPAKSYFEASPLPLSNVQQLKGQEGISKEISLPSSTGTEILSLNFLQNSVGALDGLSKYERAKFIWTRPSRKIRVLLDIQNGNYKGMINSGESVQLVSSEDSPYQDQYEPSTVPSAISTADWLLLFPQTHSSSRNLNYSKQPGTGTKPLAKAILPTPPAPESPSLKGKETSKSKTVSFNLPSSLQKE